MQILPHRGISAADIELNGPRFVYGWRLPISEGQFDANRSPVYNPTYVTQSVTSSWTVQSSYTAGYMGSFYIYFLKRCFQKIVAQRNELQLLIHLDLFLAEHFH